MFDCFKPLIGLEDLDSCIFEDVDLEDEEYLQELEDALECATEWLNVLTGGQFGTKTVTFAPTPENCGVCNNSKLKCCKQHPLTVPAQFAPVVCIEEIVFDCVRQDLADYTVQCDSKGQFHLVKHNGPWPVSQCPQYCPPCDNEGLWCSDLTSSPFNENMKWITVNGVRHDVPANWASMSIQDRIDWYLSFLPTGTEVQGDPTSFPTVCSPTEQEIGYFYISIDGFFANNPHWYEVECPEGSISNPGPDYVAPTCPKSWSVTLTYGNPLPMMGKKALALLTKELMYSCHAPSKCSLPSGVTSVTRQGVSMRVQDSGAASTSTTGLPSVDRFIKMVNPYGLRAKTTFTSTNSGCNYTILTPPCK